MLRRIGAVLVLGMLLLAVPSVPALGAEYPSFTAYVVDTVGLFSAGQRAEMERVLADFEAATTIQFAVAVIESTDGQEIAEYGTDLYNHWHLGQKGEDNGALLTIATEDRQFWITTGYGIEDRLTDARCGDIYRAYIRPYFQEGKYYEGTMGALQQMIVYAAPDYQPATTKIPARAAPAKDQDSLSLFWTIILFIIFVFLGSLGNSGRTRRYWGRRGFSSGGGFWGGGFGGGGGFSGGGGGRSGGGGAGGGW